MCYRASPLDRDQPTRHDLIIASPSLHRNKSGSSNILLSPLPPSLPPFKPPSTLWVGRRLLMEFKHWRREERQTGFSERLLIIDKHDAIQILPLFQNPPAPVSIYAKSRNVSRRQILRIDRKTHSNGGRERREFQINDRDSGSVGCLHVWNIDRRRWRRYYACYSPSSSFFLSLPWCEC